MQVVLHPVVKKLEVLRLLSLHVKHARFQVCRANVSGQKVNNHPSHAVFVLGKSHLQAMIVFVGDIPRRLR